jgi:hypothetical protein
VIEEVSCNSVSAEPSTANATKAGPIAVIHARANKGAPTSAAATTKERVTRLDPTMRVTAAAPAIAPIP